jgi:hypothetical protein
MNRNSTTKKPKKSRIKNFAYKAGADNKIFKCVPEIAIKMKDIKNKIFAEGPKAFPGFHVFLAANMAITANDSGSVI